MADLTSLEKVRRYLFGNDTTLDADEILADLITSSSAWVLSQIGREFGIRTVTETRNGDGSSLLLLRESPASSVTSVTVDGSVIPQRSAVGGSGWVLYDGGVELVGYVFSRGVQNVAIVYSAGEAVPAEIEQATIEHVALKYRDRQRVGLASQTSDGDSSSFSNAGTLAYIEGVLDRYRGLVVA